MVAQLDLIGETFGELTVQARAGTMQYGRPCAGWLCECACGRQEPIAQIALTRGRVNCCSHCRRPDCIVCGKKVPSSRPRSNTCSESCGRTKNRAQWRAYYHRNVSLEFNQRRHRRVLEKMAEDADYAERVRAIRRAAGARWRHDPRNREAIQRYMAAYWADNREAIAAKRKARLDAMSAEQLEHWLARMRDYQRAYHRRYRALIRQDPDMHARHLEMQRERRARQSLLRLMKTGQDLSSRMSNATNTDK